jgi:addiction module RelB/DinJ family antitoxin
VSTTGYNEEQGGGDVSQLKTAQQETRINIRIDSGVKADAEYVFSKLGLNLSQGVNIYLRRVAAEKGIPFPMKLVGADLIGDDAAAMETAFAGAVQDAIARKREKGLPVARYDAETKQAYLEYPDGRREY